MAFVTFNPSNSLTSLVSAIFNNSGGASLVNGSVSIKTGSITGEPSTISFYDGALSALGIGGGLLLTTGDPTPPETNTTPADPGYGFDSDPTDAQDADLVNTINAAYDGTDGEGADGVRDVTWLQFQVNITDPSLLGLRLDVLFGSEEYPEYAGDFPDIAGVYVNGQNYALLNDSILQPIGVLNRNFDDFVDNTGGALPIEYDGIMPARQVTAPVHLGINTIKIAVADTGESDFDSGLFVSNLQAVSYAGFGMAQRVAVTGSGQVADTSGSQVYLGDAAANNILLTSGLDVVDGGAGLDKVTYSFGPDGISGGSFNGTTLHLQSGANASELVHVERVSLAGGYYFALDTSPGGNTYSAYALLQAALNTAPTNTLLSQWTAVTDTQLAQGHDLGDVAQQMINLYASGVSNEAVIGYIYQNIAGTPASSDTVAELAAQVGPGHAFATMGDMVATAAMLSLNTDEIAGIVGSLQQLDATFFG